MSLIKRRFPILFIATYLLIGFSVVLFSSFPALFSKASVAASWTNNGVAADTYGPLNSNELVLDLDMPNPVADTVITNEGVVVAGDALTAFDGTEPGLEIYIDSGTDNNAYDDGEDIFVQVHNGSDSYSTGNAIQSFSANELSYFDDHTGTDGDYDEGEAIIKDTNGDGHPSSTDIVRTAGKAKVEALTTGDNVCFDGIIVNNSEYDSGEQIWWDAGGNCAAFNSGTDIMLVANSQPPTGTSTEFGTEQEVAFLDDDNNGSYTCSRGGTCETIVYSGVNGVNLADDDNLPTTTVFFNSSTLADGIWFIGIGWDENGGAEDLNDFFVATSIFGYIAAAPSTAYSNGDDIFAMVHNGAGTIFTDDLESRTFSSSDKYHDADSSTTYTDGEDILTDTDASGYYNADKLSSIVIANSGGAGGTAVDADITEITVWQESGVTAGFQASEDVEIGSDNVAPMFGATIDVSGASSVFTSSSAWQRIYVTVCISATPTAGATLKVEVPVDGALFISETGNTSTELDGPTDAIIENANAQTLTLSTVINCSVGSPRNITQGEGGDFASGDDLILHGNGTCVLTNAATLASLVVGDVGGAEATVLKHPDNSTEQVSSLSVTATGNITIYAGASINVDGLGYDGGTGGGGNGNGPGHGHYAWFGTGASHGGDGGAESENKGYCAITNPATIGSGGGSGAGGPGGAGGGLITLSATGTVTISGTISADGGNGTGGWGGGGSGGAVKITAATIAGTPASFTVTGGNGGGGGDYGGAGGCIYLGYTTANSIGVDNVTMNGGTGAQYGGAGQFFIVDTDSGDNGDLYLVNGGTAGAASTQKAATSLSVDSITLNGEADYTIPSGASLTLVDASPLLGGNGASETITVAGTLTYTTGTNYDNLIISVSSGGVLNNSLGGTISITSDGGLSVVSGATVTTDIATLNSAGALTLGSGATHLDIADLSISAGTTTINATAIASVTISDDLIMTGGTLTHGDNSTLQTNVLNLTVGGDVNIGVAASINVDWLGYDGGAATADGNGPGKGYYAWYGTGAGHGGDGGTTVVGGSGGTADCTSSNPATIGSGSGGGAGGGGSSGGGLIIISATGTVTISGTISADGKNDSNGWGGGGAGGAIKITADTVAGDGSITATGGNGAAGSAGGGGGGCVLIEYITANSIASATVTGGTGFEAGDAGVFTATQLLRPTMLAATTLTADTNNNGTVDQITIAFSAAVKIVDGVEGDGLSSLALSSGCTIPNADYGTLSTVSLVISGLTGCTGADTSITPTVTYSSVANCTTAGSICDASNGLQMANAHEITSTDGAAPAILIAIFSDITSVNGTVDRVDILFSENVVLDEYDDADWTFGNNASLNLADTAAVADGAEIRLTVTADANETSASATPTITYTAATGTANSVHDANNNNTANSAATNVLDVAAPYPRTATYSDSNADGKVDRIALLFTENTIFTYAAADWAFSSAGDINISGDFDNAECAGSGTTTITCTDAGTGTIDADANKTGKQTTGGAEPTWAYTNNSNNILDADLNATATVSKTLTDGAAAIITTRVTKDTDSVEGAAGTVDGTMNGILATFTEAMDASSVAATDFVVTLNNGTALTETYGDTTDNTTLFFGVTDSTANDTSNLLKLQITGGDGISDYAGVAVAAEGASSAATDGAAPVVITQVYQDNDTNGTVDRLTLTLSETASTQTAVLGDFAYVANDITGSAIAGGVLSYPTGTTVRIVLGTPGGAGITSHTIAPTLAYTDGGGTAIADAAGNQLSTYAARNLSDGAAPVISTFTYQDNDSDGKIDRIVVAYSETVTAASVLSANDLLLTNVGDFTALAFGANATDLITGSVAFTTVTLGTESTAIDTNEGSGLIAISSQNLFSLTDGTNTNNTLGAQSQATFTDGAAPVYLSSLYKDTDNNGAVDRIDLTFSEAVTLDEYDDDDWSFPTVGTVTLNDETAAVAVSADIRLSAAGAANVTGGVTAPTVSYDATGGTANSVHDTANNNTSSFGPNAISDGAKPAPVSAAYKDIDGNGAIDRVDVTMSADIGLACTFNAADWSFPTPGSITINTPSACAISGNDIRVSVSADANETGGTTAPTVLYTNNANRVTDAASNNTVTFDPVVTISDAASPVIVNTYSADPDNDGDVNAIDITFSENILDSTIDELGERDNFEFDNDSTNNATGEETVSGGSTTVVYPAADADANDQYYRLTITTGITGTELAYLHMNTATITDASSNLIATGNALGTENDRADPVIMTTSPANLGVDIEADANVVLTFSEAMTTASLVAAADPVTPLGSATWTVGNTVATYSDHDDFSGGTLHTFTVSEAESAAAGDGSLAAGPVANPFTFTTASLGRPGGLGGGGADTNAIIAAEVTSPNGGESWTGNSSHNITWMTRGAGIVRIKLLYSLDRGSSFPYVIADHESNDGSYTWTVPNISSSSAKVRVEALSSIGGLIASDISNADFTITAVAPSTSTTLSTIVASPTSVPANGSSTSTITVTARNDSGAAAGSKTVTLTSSRGTSDTITPATATTNATGVATFTVLSSTAGTSTYTATVDGNTLSSTASISFTAVSTGEEGEEGEEDTTPAEPPVSLSVGDLIKSSLSTSVYYYGSDNKRHLFPNEKTYKSWYTDWSSVKTIPVSQLQGISLGHNVTVRPGTVLLKIETDPKVYAVEPGGLLRWVPTEARALALYGSNWNTQIIDVPLIYWVDYSFGSDITSDRHPTGTLIQYTGTTEVYYVQGSEKRHFTGAALEANKFQTKYIETIPETISYTNGTDISGIETALVNIY